VPGYRHVAEHQDLAGRVAWKVELGEASVVMCDQAFASMFERVVSMRSNVDASRELDGVFAVAIQEVRFDWTVQSRRRSSAAVPIRSNSNGPRVIGPSCRRRSASDHSAGPTIWRCTCSTWPRMSALV
jgi:hypothetical protein